MTRKTLEKILGCTTFISMYLPAIVLWLKRGDQHYCHYDECMIIYTEGRFGSCIESMIDSICLGIAVIWWFVIIGGAIILSKDKNALSPFIIAILVIISAIILACMDPSKWEFALSLIPSLILLIIATYIDNKKQSLTKK